MDEACFFARVVRPKSWFKFAKEPEAKHGDVDALFQTFTQRLEEEVEQEPDGLFGRISRNPQGLSLSPRQTQAAKVQKYVMGADAQCAMTVLPAATAIGGHLVRVLPYVYSEKGLLLCFFGFLKNMSDLEERVDAGDGNSGDVGYQTTSLIVGLYRQLQNEKKEVLLLSELQGHYAFFLYDSERKQVLAARDPSGAQDLFYSADPEDGSIAFTNLLEQLPAREQQRRWIEVPPGHYVGGKTQTLHQFALTPEQLQMTRERNESGDIGLWIDEGIEERVSPPKPGLFRRLSQRLKA